MDDLELEAVGIAEEGCIVAGVVVVLRGGVEDLGTEGDERLVDAVDLLAVDGVGLLVAVSSRPLGIRV